MKDCTFFVTSFVRYLRNRRWQSETVLAIAPAMLPDRKLTAGAQELITVV